MSLLDNSLLVYTADNTLYHFLVIPTKETIKLHLCGSISFQGILQVPSRVRALSWMIPQAQKGELFYYLTTEIWDEDEERFGDGRWANW